MTEADAEPAAGPGPRQAALIFIFITVVLDMLALGMVIPVLPILVQTFMGGDTARASEVFGLFATAWAAMQFLFSPIQGALSDRFGRRPVILISNFGLGLDYVFMALAPSLALLFIGRVISGITAASISTAFAYVADVTPPEKRAASFGLIGAAFGIGFVLGPALGGLLGAIDPRAPFSWRSANPIGSLALLRSHPELFGLAAVNFLGNVAHAVLPTITVLYMAYRYGFDERQVGLTLALVGACSLVVQLGLIRIFVARYGERVALLVGLVFGAAGFALYGVATTPAVFLLGVPVMALWGFAGPAAQGLMTRRVGPSEQGRLQGANASIQGIANLLGPSLFAFLFAYFIGAGRDWHLPGAPFLLAALLLAAAAILAWRVTRAR
jgi:MFS transporter, DHA1 family, tetracycline resistance protein